jgi:O-antigen/teichoic acid export membrane protein
MRICTADAARMASAHSAANTIKVRVFTGAHHRRALDAPTAHAASTASTASTASCSRRSAHLLHPFSARPSQGRRRARRYAGDAVGRTSGEIDDRSPAFDEALNRMAQRAQRLIEAAKRPLPEGTFVVGIGLAISGLTTYGFQIIAFRVLTKTDYTALSGLWVVTFVLAPGFFLPLEQEIGRAIAHRRARGLGGGPVVRRAAALGAALATSLVVLTLVAEVALKALFGSGLSGELFKGHTVLVLCLVVSLLTYASQHGSRGTLSGNGRFGAYSVIIGAEGVIRLGPTVLLYAAGVHEIVWYGLCFAIPPVLAVLIGLRGQHGLLEAGPDAPWSELSVNLGWLFGGSVFAQALSYSPVLAVLLYESGKHQHDQAANFIVGFFVARVPILLFQAVQAALLPRLAALSGSGREDDFREGLRKLVAVVVGIGLVGLLAGASIGPAAGGILFGNKFDLGNRDLALLAAGSGLFILALTLAQALIALLGHARATTAWLIGNVVFWLAAATATDSLLLRGEIGFVLGAGAAAATMAWLLVRQMRRGIGTDSLASLVEAIEHEPLEI